MKYALYLTAIVFPNHLLSDSINPELVTRHSCTVFFTSFRRRRQDTQEPLAKNNKSPLTAMSNSELQAVIPPEIDELLDLRFNSANFSLLDSVTRPRNLSAVSEIYDNHLRDLDFVFSHELSVESGIGKRTSQPTRILVYLNVDEKAYALLTDLYHDKFWVYFTHYFTRDRRIITTCQPGAMQLDQMVATEDIASYYLERTRSGSLANQWNIHQETIASRLPLENPLLMNPQQHMDAERQAYRKYTDFLLQCTVLRQSDTELLSFTQTGARSFLAATSSKSGKRPKPQIHAWLGKKNKIPLAERINYRQVALYSSAALFALITFNFYTFIKKDEPDLTTQTIAKPTEKLEQAPIQSALVISPESPSTTEPVAATAEQNPHNKPASNESLAKKTSEKPEHFIVASDEDEMWRIAVENAEFYLMSNDGNPAPWIRTARKMAAKFDDDDPRLARTYFLAALLERDAQIAEQQYNRALSIQTKTLGLYHAETAQTLEALAWIAEGTEDDLEAAITHQKLALNVYRSIFGKDAEDTRAARWKLQYFEDRLAGRRPKSDENRRLLPALAKFAR